MNFKFYIFGVPKIFDLYHGNAEELSYFQQFYDEGNKENKKRTIHRKANRQLAYLYLKHNFITAEDRKNSFFGMSVVFEKEYCTDVESLYKLLDAVYKNILQNKILLEEVKGNPNIQAKFLVRSFSEVENEVKRIESIIYKNIENEFVGDIRPITDLPPVPPQNANLVRKMNDKRKNADILAALRNYNWVSLSPEYKEDIDNLNEEWIRKKKDNVENIKNDIIALYSQLIEGNIYVVNDNINKLENTVNTVLATIQKYIKNQPELQVQKDQYSELAEQLKVLIQAVEKVGSGINTDKTGTKEPVGTGTTPLSDLNKRPSFWKKHKPQLIAAVAVFVLVVVVGAIFLMQNKLKDTATPKISPAPVANPSKRETPHNAEQDKKTVKDLFDKALDEANKKDYQKQLSFLKQAKEYSYAYELNPNLDNDIDELQKQVDKQIADAAKAEQKRKNDEEKKDSTKNNSIETPTNVTIQFSTTQKIFSVGEKLTATAKSGQTVCQGGIWKFEEGLYADATTNPATVEIKSVPSTGKAILAYWIGNKRVATSEINIKP